MSDRVHVSFDAAGDIVEYELAPSDEQAAFGWRMMMLAPTLEVYEALMLGERVPLRALEPSWVKRFGLRR